MRLLFSTKDLVLMGRPVVGFPILLDDDMRSLEPAQSFITYLLLERHGASSPLTWEDYGRRLYDFFAFLHANELAWNERARAPGLSVVARYKDWSLGELALSPSTINQRLRLVVKFYEWARNNAHIDHLPFAYEDVRTTRVSQGFLAHVEQAGGVRERPMVMAREWKRPPQFLTKDQVGACRAQKLSASHRLLFDLMERVGLRSVEARTFPLKYVFNPKGAVAVKPGQMIRVNLDPADMKIKYDKPRSVDVPYTLMEDMYSYTLFQRAMLHQRSGMPTLCLILNELGRPYTRPAIVDVFKGIERKVGFRIRAHMLRHTYGTYTLARLRKNGDFEGEPLLYVRDRMGHSDVQTTAVYLHVINQLSAQMILAHEDEIDQLFENAAAEAV